MCLHLLTLRTTPRIVGNNFCFLADYSLPTHLIALTEAYYIYESPFFRDFQIKNIQLYLVRWASHPPLAVGGQDSHPTRLDNLIYLLKIPLVFLESIITRKLRPNYLGNYTMNRLLSSVFLLQI